MHSYDDFRENDNGNHSKMHGNSSYAVGSSRYFAMFNFSAHEGAANFRCDVSDNGFLSPLWPDGVSETKHLNHFDEGAHCSNNEISIFGYAEKW